MTLLNTVANLGAKWPPSLALYGVDALAGRVRDPFAFELAVCTAAGVAWLLAARPVVARLQDVPVARWRVGGAGFDDSKV